MKVKYVVAGHFDLDKGPTVRQHYPAHDEPLFDNDKSFGELLIPDRAHIREEERTCFTMYLDEEGWSFSPRLPSSRKYYCLNIVKSQIDSELKRGARIFSLAVITSEPWYAILRPVITVALEAYHQDPELSVVKELYDSLQELDVSVVPNFTHGEKRLLQMNKQQSLFRDIYQSRYSAYNSAASATADTHFCNVNVQFRDQSIPIKIPTDMEDFNSGDFSIIDFVRFVTSLGPVQGYHKEITVYGDATPPLVALWCAMVSGKRILIVGSRKTPTYELCSLVLACGYLGAAGGTVDTSTVVFPYLELGRMDEVSANERGYVGGVTNPAILLHPDWWDLAVHVDTRKIEISSKRRRTPPLKFPDFVTRDREVATDLADMIMNSASERAVRERIIFYGTKFSRSVAADDLAKTAAKIASSADKFVPGVGPFWAVMGEQAHFESVFQAVARKWRSMPSYERFLVTAGEHSWPEHDKVIIDFRHHYDRLRLGQLSVSAAAETYHLLATTILDSTDITQFLSANNSIYYLMHGLYHPEPSIRKEVGQLIARIKEHTAGKYYFQALSPFYSIGLNMALSL